ncbi:MAG: DNA double-strand break repair nuclease NurA [Methanobacteriaceae archaeon]|nr:DNA double-strand break repair nuclease NurA [Methanobacteriaceae archaeon]
MLNSLYSEAIKKRGKINNKIDVLDQTKTIDVDKVWFEEPISPSGNKVVVAAGDGSYNKKKYLGFNFYAVSAVSFIYDDKLDIIESSELDTIEHSSFLEDRLRNIMGVFEIKNAIKTINEYDIDYYLDDGSLLGDLIRPFPVENKLSSKNKEEIISVFKEKLEREIKDNSLGLSSSKFKEEFEDLFNLNNDSDNNNQNIDEDDLIIFLENIEKLIALSYLLKNNKKIIAISKTSSSDDLLHANVSDMAILDKFTRKQGFSKPYYKYMSTEMKRDFPVENEFFRNLTFTVFFARLEDYKNIIKIELPYRAEEDEIRKILSDLKRDSIEGYPYLLRKAHKEVVIKNVDMDNLAKIIGFYDKSGREMLN